MKPKIVKNSSKYQIGAMPNHRASEHLFTLKSIISLYIKLDISIILQLFDLKKFFDSENLRDAMNSLFNRDVKGKLYRLIYELNKDNEIRLLKPDSKTGH